MMWNTAPNRMMNKMYSQKVNFLVISDSLIESERLVILHCPKCHHAAHARTSRHLTENTKERYHQCQNINCSCTFMTMEKIEHFIVALGAIDPAPPHPTVGGQRPLWP